MSLPILPTILTQDNQCTADPIFEVRVNRRITGMDTDYADEDQIVWIDSLNDHCLADAEEFAHLETAYQEDMTIPEGWIRTGFILREEVVTSCFTRKGCEDFLERNGHNLRGRDIVGEPFIYVNTLWRNQEMIDVRNALIEAARDESNHGWLPIETAPSDGTKVDLYCAWAQTREVDAHWDGKRWINWGTDDFESPGWEEVPNPTHWMPINKPKGTT